jgi:hypothetical protein
VYGTDGYAHLVRNEPAIAAIRADPLIGGYDLAALRPRIRTECRWFAHDFAPRLQYADYTLTSNPSRKQSMQSALVSHMSPARRVTPSVFRRPMAIAIGRGQLGGNRSHRQEL